MPSFPKQLTAVMSFLLPFILLLFVLGSARVQGASIREHRLMASEPDPHRSTSYVPPNADMLKALKYIETLRQMTRAAPEEENLHSPNNDVSDLNTEKLRSMLKLTSPAQIQSEPGRDQAGEEEEEEEEQEEEGGEGNVEDKTQDWLKALLSSLEQGDRSPKPAPEVNAASHDWAGTGRRPAKLEEDGGQGEGGAYRWARQQHGSNKPLRKYPRLFEDQGEDGKEEEEEERQRTSNRESPFKRTNENLEEKYTPQNLATLQSVFEELGRLANGKAGHKRQAYDEEDEEDDDADEGMLRMRNLDYEDTPEEEDWEPLEDQIRAEEEERGNRKDFDDNEDDDDEEEEEEDDDDVDTDYDEGNFPVRRSTQSGPGEEPDDITKLVDYYLLKVLEKSEEDQQKRELEEEEKRAVRRVRQSIEPEAIYQLIRISQNLQIPPDDLLDMLRNGEGVQKAPIPQRNLAKTHVPNFLAKVEDKLNSYQKYKSPLANGYNRQLPEAQDITEDINTDDILNILGLGRLGNQKATTIKHQKSSHAPAGRQGDRMVSHAGIPEKLKDDYGDAVDEDELAAYLKGQMLALYPEPIKSKASPKRSSQPFSEKEQPIVGKFEEAIQDYFDHMDSDRSNYQKRQAETEDMGGAIQTQPLDDEALLKILTFLNPENDESEDKDLNAKSVKGM